MANQVGPLETKLPGHLPYLESSFPGLSAIIDSDGMVKADLGKEEGVIVADVLLGAKSKQKTKPKRYRKMWGIPVPWYAFLWPLTQRMGEKNYATNPRRVERALSASRGTQSITPLHQ
jgi:N-carbamoylputrescine amidase